MSSGPPRQKTSGPVTITQHYRGLSVPWQRLLDTGVRLCRRERVPRGQRIELICCSDHVIRRLNREFRGIDRPTDVLSFNYDDPDLLGEVYVSLQRADVQARRFGHAYAVEVQRLWVHGMVHLLGHDHETARDRARMEAVEARYCSL